MPQQDVLIVGGGVIGCAIARELALRGVRSTILERGEPCREASWAAAGALIARALSADEGPLLSFKVQSLALYKDHCQDLTADTGIDTGYRETGGIDFFLTESEVAEREEFLTWQRAAGVPAERLDETDLRELEPNLNPAIRHGAFFPTFTQVRTPWYTRALIASAIKHGARLESHIEVREFLLDGCRVVGVRTDRGEHFAETTILAGGPWSTELAKLLGKELPGVPVKGQIILLYDQSRPVNHIVHSGKTYITPRDEGRLVVGSTEEWVGFQRRNTVEGISKLLSSACEFYPSLGAASVEQVWHGFRPLTFDGLPFIGPVEGLEGFLCATGHYRSGIILAPITARVISDLLHREKTCFDVRLFSPNRIATTEVVNLTPRTDFH